MKLHIELLTCWITHVLPFVEKSIQDRLIQTVLCGIKRASVLDIMTILSAIVARFGLSPICSKHTGNVYSSFIQVVLFLLFMI